MTQKIISTAIISASLIYASFADGGTLTESPLFLQTAVPPNVLFSLSVEYPTANTAAYQGASDYTESSTYLGLFDSEKCYTYDSTNNWFSPTGYATSHTCSNQWSGNFLNWASMTGLDEFRYAMTGGHRYQDTASLTVVQRAYQSGQGGTSNFTDKTYTGSTATPYPAATTLTIVNQGKGVQMQVTAGGTGTALCSNPTQSGSSFSCNIALQTSGEAGSCTTWTGSGTNTSPYKCSTFGSFADGLGTPTSSSVGTKSSVSTTASDTVTCTNPSGTSSSNFSCTLTNTSNYTGSCSTWTGTGTASSPFTCSSFGTFNGQSFTTSSNGANGSYANTTQTTQSPETVSSCSTTSGKVTCTLSSGRTATCTPSSGSGTSKKPYVCNSSAAWAISGSPSATYVSNGSNSTATLSGSYYIYAPTSVTYSIPVSTTYYYVSSYSGSDTASYYYYSTYSVTFGTSSNYYVRAKVCDSSIGLESNCQIYGTSTYKPIGEVQRNGEKMRFSVFSYYNAKDIDNAVMRSKMKYVAPQMWTSSGTYTDNTNAEWSATTGIYVSNPDPTEASASWGGSVSKSGVVNYINQFGNASAGYKTLDVVGKLYYESLLYLRGTKSPTYAFYQYSTPTTSDGFPSIISWDDPVQYSCQKNYIIVMGDTHTHCDKRLPGGSITSYGNSNCSGNVNTADPQTADQGSLSTDTGVNVTTWTNAIGSLEGISSLATRTFQGSSSYYLSGLAYWAAKNGFRTKDDVTMKAKTYIIDVQEYGDKGNIGSSNWPSAASQYWYAAKYGGVDSFDSSGNPNNWYTSISGFTGNWPKTLLPAGNPAAMIAAVRSALSDISAQTGSGADIGLSTGDLRTGNGTNLYSATYDSTGWSGDVLSYRMGSDLTISTSPTWKASTFINPTTLNPTSGTQPWVTRRVLSFNDGLNADGTLDSATNHRRGIDFMAVTAGGSDVFETNFSGRQQTLLNINPATTTDDGRGDDRVNYIRGNNSNEGSSGWGWRSRTSSIGDFINSSPVYVRYPSSANVPPSDYASYKIYATAIASRTPVLYVGSNDGMLHAYNASDNSDDGTSSPGATSNSGREVLAYVPSAVYSKLPYLTWTNYSHKYFVDGTPVTADAQLSSDACTPSSDTTKCWRTIITGGLNAGGQGIYALNGTTPSTFSTASANSLVMWEFTDRDDANLGYTFAQPVVRKMNNGKWAVIFGNGFNNTASDGATSTTGRAYLFIALVDGPGIDANGKGKPWVKDTNYWRIELKAPSEGSTPLNPPNGLSTVYALDKNDDAITDYIYAADRYGNLWKIDVSSSDPANWASAFGTTDDPLPLFTATTGDTTPVKEQVTTSPIVSTHPYGGYMVMFGTGSYVDQSDNVSPFTTNSFYGIWDKDDGTRVTGRSQLQKQATLASVTSGTDTYAIQSSCEPQYSTTATTPSAATVLCPTSLAATVNGDGKVDQQLGWVLDLNNNPSKSGTGERYISSSLPILENGLLTFVTLTPSGDVCSGGGYDFTYNLDYLSGGAYSKAVYYNLTTSSASAISVSYTYTSGTGGTTTTTVYPSGKKLGTALGQNPKRIYYETDQGSGNISQGCSGFVAGRPCKKVKRGCDIVTIEGKCSSVTPPATGRVSWRQIMQ